MGPGTPNFSDDWFSHNISLWEKILAHLAGKPFLKFLEIGVFEGRATCWLMNNILTHPASSILCIDTFEGSIEHQAGQPYYVEGLGTLHDRFMQNTAPFAVRVEVKVGCSQDILRTLALSSFDFAYIDGSHHSADVLEDAVLAFRLLKPGGIMIFDDYDWDEYSGTLNNPRAGIDAFLQIFAERYALISKGHQVALTKIAEKI